MPFLHFPFRRDLPPLAGGPGADGERAAEAFLVAAGYETLERNFRCPVGEIDLVMREKQSGTICFVEVKARKPGGEGGPETAVTRAKARRVALAARHWLARRRKTRAPARFDVVAVVWSDGAPAVRHHRNAFLAQDVLPGRFV